MFIHLGGDTVISLKDIIVILNFDLESDSEITQEFLTTCQSKLQIVPISDEAPKTVVVTEDKVYYSPISSITLKRRATLPPVLDHGMEFDMHGD